MLSPFSPLGRRTADPRLEDVVQRLLGRCGQAQTASRVTGHLAHPGVGATPPFVHLPGERERLRPGGGVRSVDG